MKKASKLLLLLTPLMLLASCQGQGNSTTTDNTAVINSETSKIRLVDNGTWQLNVGETFYVYPSEIHVEGSTYTITITDKYVYIQCSYKYYPDYIFIRENISWCVRMNKQ